MAWTDDRVEKLKTLWEEGKSASEIAKELGEVTRNAVIGKVHRMGLASRTSDSAAASKATKAPPPKPVEAAEMPKAKPVEAKVDAHADGIGENEPSTPVRAPMRADTVSPEALETVERVEREAKKLTLMQLTERTCKWPIGDPSTDNFWFCGHPSHSGKPYCEAHVDLAFQAPLPRRERR